MAKLLQYSWKLQKMRKFSCESFCVYGIPEVVQSNIAIFADDTKLYIFINTPDNSSTLQSDLDLLQVECCRVWQIKFNFVNI